MSASLKAPASTFWANPELVGVMIRKCSGSDACRLACVSCALNPTVEGFIWSDVFDIDPFFTQALQQLVSTLETDEHGVLTEQSAVTLRASPPWETFRRRCHAARKAQLSLYQPQTAFFLRRIKLLEPIFPNLRHLTMFISYPNLQHLPRFLPHTLRHAFIDIFRDPHYPAAIDPQYESCFPLSALASLTFLYIRFLHGRRVLDNVEIPWLDAVLRQLPHPDRLSLLGLRGCKLSRGVGSFVATLPSLESLKLGPDAGLPTQDDGGAIAVDGTLRQLQAHSLRNLHLRIVASHAPFDISSLSACVSLVDLFILMNGTHRPTSITSLATLACLEIVELSLPELEHTLDPLQLHQLLQAWPRLRQLALCSRVRRHDDPPPLLRPTDLFCLPHHCPDLRWLGVSLYTDMDGPPAPPTFPGCSTGKLHPHTRLDLQATQVAPDADSRFLDLMGILCPQLDVLTFSGGVDRNRRWVTEMQDRHWYRRSKDADGSSDEAGGIPSRPMNIAMEA